MALRHWLKLAMPLLCLIQNALAEYNESLIEHTQWFNFVALNTDTTSGLMLYMFIILVYFGIVILGQMTRVPAIMFIGSVCGFFISYLLYVTISSIIGLIFIIVNIMLLVYSGFMLNS